MARAPIKPQVGPALFEVEEAPAPATTSGRRLVVEADGGSRGNPGPAAYGALVRDADSGELLNSEGLTVGTATNNVAEYSGLIAGLEMARAIDPGAAVEVRMDSKLVIEQMAGRWRVKHPDLKPLASAAQRLRPARVTWTWVPREKNKAADALVNAALDGQPRRRH
ncbi:MAG: reverse transcriptase-like protein [Propionicimonas sp.]